MEECCRGSKTGAIWQFAKCNDLRAGHKLWLLRVLFRSRYFAVTLLLSPLSPPVLRRLFPLSSGPAFLYDSYRPHLIGSVNLAFNCQMTVRTGKLRTHVDRKVTRVVVQAHSPNRQKHFPEQTVK